VPPGLIRSVADGSLGARVGLQEGDLLDSINGSPLRDVIDVRVYASESCLTLGFTRDGVARVAETDRRYGESLGLEFASPTFDPIRHCQNRCDFCFVDQMPQGLRSSLYLRDDDYRYSFLFGNFVTLNNLREDDWSRIVGQHLSPLYVSVHATERGLRRRMMGSARAPDVMDQLRRLIGVGVQVHTQLVLVPGVNDGEHLDQSVLDLAGLFPGVRSLSIVPVGVTRHHRGSCRVYTGAEMLATVDHIRHLQAALEVRLGVRFAYWSDEWYLSLGESVPCACAYDGLDLAENGVGAVRGFLDSADARLRSILGESSRQTLVTGTLFAPVLRQAVAEYPRLTVVPVVNAFFGDTVTVAGLLTAQDVIGHLAGQGISERVVLPPEMFGGPDGTTLDGLTVGEVERSVGCPVLIGEPRQLGGLRCRS